MDVTLEQAYAEACRVIGEQIVAQRIIDKAPATADNDGPSTAG